MLSVEKLENTCKQKKCVFCRPIFFCFILNKNEAIIQCVLFCKLLACQQTCLGDYLNSFLVVSPASVRVFSVSPDTYVLLEHWEAPFALCAWCRTRPRSRRTFQGRQAGEVTDRDAAVYHFLPMASSVNKINWAGQALLQQLFTWPFEASLRCWKHTQSSHSIFSEAVSLWSFPALQMATRPGQGVGR